MIVGHSGNQSTLADPPAASDDDERRRPLLSGLYQALQFRLTANEAGHESPWKWNEANVDFHFHHIVGAAQRLTTPWKVGSEAVNMRRC
jgi:hypothetical protein